MSPSLSPALREQLRSYCEWSNLAVAAICILQASWQIIFLERPTINVGYLLFLSVNLLLVASYARQCKEPTKVVPPPLPRNRLRP